MENDEEIVDAQLRREEAGISEFHHHINAKDECPYEKKKEEEKLEKDLTHDFETGIKSDLYMNHDEPCQLNSKQQM